MPIYTQEGVQVRACRYSTVKRAKVTKGSTQERDWERGNKIGNAENSSSEMIRLPRLIK